MLRSSRTWTRHDSPSLYAQYTTGVIVGVVVGLLLNVLFALSLLVCTSAGVVTFLVSLGIHQRYQWGQWRRLEQNLAALFPSQENVAERAKP